MSPELDDRLLLGESLVRYAGETALAAYRDPDLSISNKSPGDLVTDADFAIEKALRARLANSFPDDGIIGEEFGREHPSGDYLWLIDPIDGTVNFARRLGYFCISIALLKGGRTVAAWIFDPINDELFFADPTGAAWLDGKPIACSGIDIMTETVVGLGFSARHEKSLYAALIGQLALSGAEHRRLGSGALSLAHVASGRIEAYLEPHMNPWDAVGGLYIAACAGALTNDYLGAGGLQAGATVFAAAPGIARQLLAVVPEPFSGTPLHREMRGGVPETLRDDRKPHPNVETIQ